MKMSFPAASVLVLAVSLTACAKLGPTTLKAERNNYNIAVQRTNDEQLMLNLVRLKYRDTPFFLEVSSVASQFTLSANADASASLTDPRPGIFGFGAGASITERPTVTYSPLQGEKFIQRVLSPIPMETLALLYHSGWSVERIFRLCLQRLNKLKNAPSASGPTPARAPDFEAFARATKLLRALQVRDALEVVFQNKEGLPTLVLKIPEEALDWPEARELASALGVPPRSSRYVLSTAAVSEDPAHVNIVTRSLLGIMFYLSQAVEVPARDREEGRVTRTTTRAGELFDWKKVTQGLLRIQSRASRPDSAAAWVYYRGSWFYIDDSDLNSKSTFSLLAQIFSLQAGKIKSTAPVLTLPVGQ